MSNLVLIHHHYQGLVSFLLVSFVFSCRNTVFNAKAQTAGPYLLDLAAAGFERWRVELVDEPAAFVGPLVTQYARALDAAHAGSSAASSAAPGQHSRKVGKAESSQADSSSGYAATAAELLLFLATVPDANGRTHGATEGSLKPTEERKWDTLRPTAATTKAAAKEKLPISFSSSYK
jgi:hypothetical protein